MPRSLTRSLAALGAMGAAIVLAAAPAAAHTALVSSSPAEGATVTELTEVSLEFTEQLLDIGNELAIETSDGTRTALAIEEPVTETVTAAVPDDALVAGDITLAYRVVSADGHPIEGTVAFTYAPATPVASASPSPSVSPDATASAAPSLTVRVTATASAAPSAEPAPAEEVGPNPAVYVIIAAVAAAALALTLALRKR